MFQRTGATLIKDENCPNFNPKAPPFPHFAKLTWLEADGSLTITYGCRKSYAQFTTFQALAHYYGRKFNGKTGKRQVAKPQPTPADLFSDMLKQYIDELEQWKTRARVAEAQLNNLRKALQGIKQS